MILILCFHEDKVEVWMVSVCYAVVAVTLCLYGIKERSYALGYDEYSLRGVNILMSFVVEVVRNGLWLWYL